MSLLDTIHDYGNIGRAENVFNRNQENENNVTNTNSNSQEEISTSLNSILVDFVMLGYFHKYFRKILNLKDIYVTQEEKCNQANSSFINMCKKFYFPTYADKLIFRSSNPEEIQKRANNRKKPILMSKNEQCLQEWPTAKEAGLALGISSGDICSILKGRQKTAKGLTFKYKHND
jgi:hypothetical protein